MLDGRSSLMLHWEEFWSHGFAAEAALVMLPGLQSCLMFQAQPPMSRQRLAAFARAGNVPQPRGPSPPRYTPALARSRKATCRTPKVAERIDHRICRSPAGAPMALALAASSLAAEWVAPRGVAMGGGAEARQAGARVRQRAESAASQLGEAYRACFHLASTEGLGDMGSGSRPGRLTALSIAAVATFSLACESSRRLPRPAPHCLAMSSCPLSVVSRLFPDITRETSTGRNLTATGNPKATRMVIYETGDGSKKVTITVDQYGSSSDASSAYQQAVQKSQSVPGFKPVPVPNVRPTDFRRHRDPWARRRTSASARWTTS